MQNVLFYFNILKKSKLYINNYFIVYEGKFKKIYTYDTNSMTLT